LNGVKIEQFGVYHMSDTLVVVTARVNDEWYHRTTVLSYNLECQFSECVNCRIYN